MKRDFNLLSLIIPMYNEELWLAEFFNTVIPILALLKKPFEIICINDGSTDKTLRQLIELQKQHREISIIDFFKNFGKEAGLTAGFNYASGDILIPIDADLQDSPYIIPDLINKWREGFDEVIAVRRTRKTDSWLKQFTASMFYKGFNKLSDYKIQYNAGDFRLLDRSIVDVILTLNEKNRFMKGIYSWASNGNQAIVEFDREPRFEGRTKWTYWKLWNFALDGITAFSHLPLRVWSYIGTLISGVAFIYMCIILVKTTIWGNPTPGYSSMMCVFLFCGGIQLLSLGVLGEYVGRIYQESKNRPGYIVKKHYKSQK